MGQNIGKPNKQTKKRDIRIQVVNQGEKESQQ
jgi:hypothetical protein